MGEAHLQSITEGGESMIIFSSRSEKGMESTRANKRKMMSGSQILRRMRMQKWPGCWSGTAGRRYPRGRRR